MVRDYLYALIITPAPIRVDQQSLPVPLRHVRIHKSQIEFGGAYLFERSISCAAPPPPIGQTQVVFHALDDICTKIAYAYGVISWFSKITGEDTSVFADWMSAMLGRSVRFCYSELDIKVPSLRHAKTLLGIDENGIPMFVHFIFSSINGIIVLDRRYCTIEDIQEMGEEATGEEHTNETLRHQMRFAIDRLKNDLDEYDSYDVWIVMADENKSVLHPISGWSKIRAFLRGLVLTKEREFDLKEHPHPLDYRRGLHLLQCETPYLFAAPSLVVGTMGAPVLIDFLERVGEGRLRVIRIKDRYNGRCFEACADSVSWLPEYNTSFWNTLKEV